MRYNSWTVIDGGSKSLQKHIISMVMFAKKKFKIDPYIEIYFRGDSYGLGGCVEIDDGEYQIDLRRSMKLKEMLMTLAHELVHVIPYWDKPSEIEAYGRELGLFITWAEENNLGNKAWTQD